MEKRNYNRIKSALVDAGITNKELAKELGRSLTTVSRWCTNDQQPSIDVLFAIADYLDMFAGDLLVRKKIHSSSPKK